MVVPNYLSSFEALSAVSEQTCFYSMRLLASRQTPELSYTAKSRLSDPKSQSPSLGPFVIIAVFSSPTVRCPFVNILRPTNNLLQGGVHTISVFLIFF
jgi:hypothetical protein